MSFISPTKQKILKKKFYGFDIETYDDNKKFLCASIYSDDYQKTFYDKRELIKEFKTKKFYNSYVCATNLSFDFFGVFFNEPEAQEFKPLFRGSDLIFAKTYIKNGDFSITPAKNLRNIQFVDTMNYGRLSVEKMGRLLKSLKLERPKSLGRKPKNKSEWVEMVRYNMKDAEISYKFMCFLKESFEALGATFKKTIASTAMSLFKNKYLKSTYFTHHEEDLIFQFEGYYGGRCEAFKRGFSDTPHNYYDFNSLYPSCMINNFPDPNSMRKNSVNSVSYISSYEGFADVDVYCPPEILPLLPCRIDKKLLFPSGSFRGVFTNLELRKAMQLGYVIKRVYKNMYFKKTCRPFDDYVKDLYEKRMKFKEKNNPMEYVIKILLNSLYGKFGEKFLNRENIVPCSIPYDELIKYSYRERIGDYFRVGNSRTMPKSHCIPSWAAYITAYARIKLYDVLVISDAAYCDTDSIITMRNFHNSGELGALKKEHDIKKMIIVRPKFYMLDNSEKKIFKVKGAGKKICLDDFNAILFTGKISYSKFMRFKESIRRGFIPNEIQPIIKIFSLEDNKREWDSPFSAEKLQQSFPITLKEGKITERFIYSDDNEELEQEVKLNG